MNFHGWAVAITLLMHADQGKVNKIRLNYENFIYTHLFSFYTQQEQIVAVFV